MADWRRFERPRVDGGSDYREIRRGGIRCFLRWGTTGGSGKASTSTLNDAEAARRHEARKTAEWRRKGFAEVAAPSDAEAGRQHGPGIPASPAAVPVPVLDVLRQPRGPYAQVPDYQAVAGYDEVYHQAVSPDHPRGFHEYLVLADGGRTAVHFAVRSAGHDPDTVGVFLDFLSARRSLAFDGASHHKTPLPRPVGPFSHALFCSPALGRAFIAYPAIADRVASAFPIHDCEIGDHDTEVFVDARIHGGGLPRADWHRAPYPVVDLRFDVRPSHYRPSKTFKVFRPADLDALLQALPAATADSWLEVRSFRGTVLRRTPDSITPASTTPGSTTADGATPESTTPDSTTPASDLTAFLTSGGPEPLAATAADSG